MQQTLPFIVNKDGYRLIPVSASNIEFYSLLEDGTQLAINNLPLNFTNRIKIPLSLNVYKNQEPVAGKYNVHFQAQNLASGAYFYRLTAGSKVYKELSIFNIPSVELKVDNGGC